jgi:hypothetical protein
MATSSSSGITTFPVVGLGSTHSRKRPDIDSDYYSWRVLEWIGNYNVARVEYWVEPEPSTDYPL